MSISTHRSRPPKGSGKRKNTTVYSDDSPTPPVPTLAEQLSYLQYARPFKNPHYTKNVNRRTKNLKAVLTQEREREKNEREKRRVEKEESMDVDGHSPPEDPLEDDLPTCEQFPTLHFPASNPPPAAVDASIEAPPSVLPQRRYCDITGLEGPYTDPATGLRYHDKSIYELIKGLSAPAAKEYLAARGVNPIVK
uniref:Non-canonical non-ribosomal peptide synthetase FUB8 ) n=1 Tax=Ganoderma boninense TaxID=34458 RepID=A0A5K1JZ38_9APHY|nr:Non-canonical non-ribosomal peptide synthetase FUB8 (EC (Fusaric acid biosynthesis protein 8) [Ganoderma boninense]